MNTKIEWLIEKPLNEVDFKWYDYDGNEVEYGKHVPWLFQVYGEGFDETKVVKVELPVCDYRLNNKNPIVKIYLEDVIEN